MIWIICVHLRGRCISCSQRFRKGSESEKSQHLLSLPHICSMGLKPGEPDTEQSFGFYVLAKNASPVNFRVIVHKNEIRTHVCKK